MPRRHVVNGKFRNEGLHFVRDTVGNENFRRGDAGKFRGERFAGRRRRTERAVREREPHETDGFGVLFDGKRQKY